MRRLRTAAATAGTVGPLAVSSRRGCAISRADLRIREYTGRLPDTVPARGRAHLTGVLPIATPRQATARCAGTRFTIVLSGTGTKATR